MSRIEDIVRAAEEDRSQGNVLSAVEKYSDAITLSPRLLPLYLGRHFCFTQLRLHREALKDLQYIIQKTSFLEEVTGYLEPLFEIRADAFYYSGEIFFKAQEWSKSFGAYEENIRILNLLSEENVTFTMKKASSYFKKGLILQDKKERIPEAIIEFTESLRLSREILSLERRDIQRTVIENHLKQTSFARAVCYERIENYEAAMCDYLNLGDFAGNYYAGKMYFYAGRLGNAERHLEVCMELPEVKAELRVHAAQLLLQTKLGLQTHVNN